MKLIIVVSLTERSGVGAGIVVGGSVTQEGEQLFVAGAQVTLHGAQVLTNRGFGGIGIGVVAKDERLGTDKASEGGDRKGEQAQGLELFGEGGEVNGGIAEVGDMMTHDFDLGEQVDGSTFVRGVEGIFLARGEAVLASVLVAGRGTAFALGGGGGSGHGEEAISG